MGSAAIGGLSESSVSYAAYDPESEADLCSV